MQETTIFAGSLAIEVVALLPVPSEYFLAFRCVQMSNLFDLTLYFRLLWDREGRCNESNPGLHLLVAGALISFQWHEPKYRYCSVGANIHSKAAKGPPDTQVALEKWIDPTIGV